MLSPTLLPAPTAVRPRVLFLSCHLPWPAISGGRRRELELIRRLARRFDIHLLVVSKTFGEDRRGVPALQRLCREVEVHPAAPAAEDPTGEPWQVRRHRSPSARARVEEILALEAVDLVHVEGYYLMQHVPRWTSAPVVLVEQNVEYELERQRCRMSASHGEAPARREYLRARAAEIESWSRASTVAAVTPEDRQLIRDGLAGDCVAALDPPAVTLVPDGADHVPHLRAVDGAHRPGRPAAPLVTLPANFAYSPNVDAALHLCRDILPRLRRRLPEVQLWLAGNEPPLEVQALAGDGVRVTGRVADLAPYLEVSDVVACPLRIGGGIKVKAIEALRLGKALVSTSVGVQGLPAEARDAIVIADDPPSFAEALVSLLSDPRQRAELEARAAHAGTVLPSWDDAAAALTAIYEDLLDRQPRPVAASARGIAEATG